MGMLYNPFYDLRVVEDGYDHTKLDLPPDRVPQSSMKESAENSTRLAEMIMQKYYNKVRQPLPDYSKELPNYNEQTKQVLSNLLQPLDVKPNQDYIRELEDQERFISGQKLKTDISPLLAALSGEGLVSNQLLQSYRRPESFEDRINLLDALQGKKFQAKSKIEDQKIKRAEKITEILKDAQKSAIDRANLLINAGKLEPEQYANFIKAYSQKTTAETLGDFYGRRYAGGPAPKTPEVYKPRSYDALDKDDKKSIETFVLTNKDLKAAFPKESKDINFVWGTAQEIFRRQENYRKDGINKTYDQILKEMIGEKNPPKARMENPLAEALAGISTYRGMY